MKRVIFIVMFFLAFSILFISCGGKENKGIKIKIWHQMQVEGRDVLQRVCNKYMQEHPNVQIELLYKETEELRSGFQTASLAGAGPEIVYGPSDQVGPFSKMELILPLENVFDPVFLKQFDPKALTYFNNHLCQIGDRIGNHLSLVYNKKLVPEPPENSDELIELGKKLTQDKNGDGRIDIYALVWNFTEPYFFIPFLGGFGGWIMDSAGKPTLDTPATIDAFKFIVALRDTYKIIPKEADYDMADALFKEGRAGMIINGPWSWAGYKKSGIDIGIARIPKISKTGLWPTPMYSPKGYSINKNVKPELLIEVKKVIEYLTSPAVELQFTKALGTIPSAIPARSDSLVVNNPLIVQSQYQLDVCKPMPVVPELRAIWDALRPAYQAVLNGTMTPAKAAESAQKNTEKKIKEMYE
ncbi:hypothetical protein DRQ29_03360 [bacterium]|nr:extracellular solute-binding protein [bacterium]RKZ27616.1 MAG: hypothetical protein DRQ29_03360 [bacterium]